MYTYKSMSNRNEHFYEHHWDNFLQGSILGVFSKIDFLCKKLPLWVLLFLFYYFLLNTLSGTRTFLSTLIVIKTLFFKYSMVPFSAYEVIYGWNKENGIYIRGEFTRKKCKTAILLYCFHTAGVLHIFMLYNLLCPGISFYRNLKLMLKENQIMK